MKSTVLVLLSSSFLFLIISAAIAARLEPDGSPRHKGVGNEDFGIGGFLPPADGYSIPEFGPVIGGGYGSGYGGPNGGHSKSGIIRPSVVCKEKGPCYLKKLTCPAKCFSAYGRSGKGYGGGGGGGGCTIDCQIKCTAYC